MNESYAENLIFGKFILFPEFTNMAQSCHINSHNKVEDGIDEELANRLGGVLHTMDQIKPTLFSDAYNHYASDYVNAGKYVFVHNHYNDIAPI